jgi:hypothetical protein
MTSMTTFSLAVSGRFICSCHLLGDISSFQSSQTIRPRSYLLQKQYSKHAMKVRNRVLSVLHAAVCLRERLKETPPLIKQITPKITLPFTSHYFHFQCKISEHRFSRLQTDCSPFYPAEETVWKCVTVQIVGNNSNKSTFDSGGN